MVTDMARVVRVHWFYVVVPVFFAAALAIRQSLPWTSNPQMAEAVTLLDWCVVMPALYAICYRHMSPRALMIRMAALACGGIWIAGLIVPDHAESFLTQWGWVRGVGMAGLLLVEGAALISQVRVAFSPTPDADALARLGMPPLLIRFALAEARFWRWLFAHLRGK